MPDHDDDLSSEDEDEALGEFEQLSERLFNLVSEFADDEELPDELLSQLLLELSLTTRMMAYSMSVAKPSAGGLKLDLDRFRQDADDLIREMKKDADGYIARAKEAIAAAEAEDDES